MEDYFDDSDDILRVARMFRKRMTCNIDDPQLILKIKFYVLTNKELDTALLDANLLENNDPEEKREPQRKPAQPKRSRKQTLTVNRWKSTCGIRNFL